MMAPRINRDVLERSDPPGLSAGLAEAGETPAAPADASAAPGAAPLTPGGQLSRRHLLGLAIGAAGLAPAAAQALAAAGQGRLTVVESRGRIEVLWDGQVRWVLDRAAFAGRPRLAVARSEAAIVVSLSGGRWPGTRLAADLQARFERVLGGWRLDLELPGLGFRASGPAERWLLGQPLRSTVHLDTVLALGPGAQLRLPREARGELGADWVLRLGGRGVAALALDGAWLSSDDISLSLPDPSQPSLHRHPARARTAILVRRGERPWAWLPALDLPAGMAWSWRREPFDAFQIELQEADSQGPRVILVAQGRAAEGQEAVAEVRPHEALNGLGGHAAPLALGALRVGLAWTGRQREMVLAGDLLGPTTWSVGGLQIELGPASTPTGGDGLAEVYHSLFGQRPALAAPGPTLRLVSLDGRRQSLALTPPLRRLRAALPGAELFGLPRPGEGGPVALRLLWSGDDPPDGLSSPSAEDARRWGSLRLDRLAAAAGRNGVAGGVAAAEAVGVASAVGVPVADLAPASASLPTSGVLNLPAGLDLVLMRPDDMLLLGFRFTNLQIQAGASPGDPRRLMPISPTAPRSIVVHLPGQSIADRVKEESGENQPAADPPPIPAALAAPSRLAYEIPAGSFTAGIPLTLASLMGWAAWEPRERVDIPNQVNEPSSAETALVLPYRLALAPGDASRMAWRHSIAPVTRFGRTELWHTRLFRRVKPGDIAANPQADPEDSRPDLLAIWSPDHAKGPAASNNRVWSLTEADRRDIVEVSEKGGAPVVVDRLFLSALGAWFAGNLQAPAANPTSLEAWTHRMAMGRDTFVRIVRRGFLVPFGHAASKVTIVERKFQTASGGRRVASLRAREYLVVRQPVRAFNHRDLPFRTVRLETLITPPLTPTDERTALPGLDPSQAFWVQTGSGAAKRDVPWLIAATDWNGAELDLDMPLVWIDAVYAGLGGNLGLAATGYNGDDQRRARPMGGQKLAYAPSAAGGGSAGGSDPVLETVLLKLGARVVDGVMQALMDEAEVRLEQLQQLAKDQAATAIKYFQGYVQSGFGAQNPGEVFAQLVNSVGLDFGAGGLGDVAGGLATPALDISGLSRKLGLGGGNLADLANGTFDPLQFLGGNAKILGLDVLSKITKLANFSGGDGASAPKIATRLDLTRRAMVTDLSWKPELQDFVPFAFNRGGISVFLLSAELATALEDNLGLGASYKTHGELTFFSLDLPILEVRFRKLLFTAASGQAAKVDPDLGDVTFKGPLAFIQKLQERLSGGALGTGPKIELKPTGIHAGFSLGLPAVAVGVMSLENLRLSTGLDLPFTGDPLRVRFAFCERQSPFVLTVSAFGGGGFVGLALGPEGVVLLEAAFEFGAQVSLNLGVASGSAGIMAGIYFKLELGEAELTGYLRCWGRLSILGIIKVSLEFYLAFTYYFANKSARGIAQLTLKIEVLFFSKTVKLTMEREFKGGGGGGGFLMAMQGAPAIEAQDRLATTLAAPLAEPRLAFADLVSQAEWDTYCEAFA